MTTSPSRLLTALIAVTSALALPTHGRPAQTAPRPAASQPAKSQPAMPTHGVSLDTSAGRSGPVFETRTLGLPLAGHDLLVARIDEDVAPDVVVVLGDDPFVGYTATVLAGDGDSGFARPTETELLQTFGYVSSPTLAAAHLDADPHLDIGVSGTSPSLFYGNGTATLGDGDWLPISGGGSQDVAFIDLDADGDLDSVALIVDFGSLWMEVGTNDGAGGLTLGFGPLAPLPFLDAASERSFLLVDLDGDGDITALQPGPEGLLMRGFWSVSDPATVVLAGPGHRDPQAADLDRDGDPDVLVSTPTTSSVTVLWNDGRGGLVPRTVSTPSPCERLTVADVSGDGRPDILGLSAADDALVLLIQSSARTFDVAATVPILDDAVALDAADLDRDGDIDVVVLGGASRALMVLENTRTP